MSARPHPAPGARRIARTRLGVTLLGIAGILACGPLGLDRPEPGPGAHRFEWIIDGRVVDVDMRRAPAAPGDPAPAFEYRVHGEPSIGSDAWHDADAFQRALEQHSRRLDRRHPVLKAVNASSWRNFIWVLIGLGGQLCFFGRMFVQWLASEREGASVVPPVFWWLSLAGGVALLGYFVWRRDPIGILGQSTGAVIYARNLWLIHRRPSRPGTAEADLPAA